MKPSLLQQALGISALALSSLALMLPGSAAAYSKVYVFGDSLSDSGNNYLLGAFDPNQVITGNSYLAGSTYAPGGGYPLGTYSNGPVWATTFAASLGLSAAPSWAGGSNYAHGGAHTSQNLPGPFSMKTQVSMFLNDTHNVADSDALYIVAGGGINAQMALQAMSDPTLTPSQRIKIIASNASNYATDIGAMVDSLQAAGAKNLVVWNSPNVGLAPVASVYGAQDTLDLLATTMNEALAYRLAGEVGVKTFDFYSFSAQVKANPASYGLLNVSDACGAASNHCDPATAMFWDGLHPTAKGHQLIASALLTQVQAVPEPSTYGLMALGLVAVVGMARRRSTQA